MEGYFLFAVGQLKFAFGLNIPCQGGVDGVE
jgi:hypothetical protein